MNTRIGSPVRASVGIAVLLAAVVSGCAGLGGTASEGEDADGGIAADRSGSSSDQSSASDGEVSIDGYSDLVADLDFTVGIAVLPLDRYYLGSPEYVVKVLHAIAVTTDECLVEAGLPAIASTVDWSPFTPYEDRRYGVWSVENASRYGLDLSPEAGPPAVDTLQYGVEFNAVYTECSDEAKESLLDQLEFSQQPNVDRQIRGRAQELAAAHPDGAAAFEAWQACMEDRGIVLEPSDGRPSAQYSEQGKEAEIQATVVEAECARNSGAIQQLYNLQARYEAVLLDAQEAQFNEFLSQREAAVEVFDAAIAGGVR